MIHHVNIEWNDFYKLEDKSGYYYVTHGNGAKMYYKDGKLHNEFSWAEHIKYYQKHYYLFGKCFGWNANYSDEEWTILAKKYIKMKAFF